MQERQFASRSELVRLVNERLRDPAEGSTCTLASVVRLSVADGDGCNWQEFGFKGIYTEGFRQALMEIQSKYNLEDEPGAFAPTPIETKSGRGIGPRTSRPRSG